MCKVEYILTDRQTGIDLLKAICSFLVVAIHIPFPGRFGSLFFLFCRIAVPIFFIITGYFWNNILNKGREYNYLKKVVIMYLGALCFYVLLNFCVSGMNFTQFIVSKITYTKMFEFLFFNSPIFAEHLWYLVALIYVIILAILLDKIKLFKVFIYLTPFLLLGDLVLGEYSIFITGMDFDNIIVRNFLFVGIPYFTIGTLLKKAKISITTKYLVILIAFFSITTLLEYWGLSRNGFSSGRVHYISTTFLAITCFCLFTKYNLSYKITLFLSKIGKKYSNFVYIVHPAIIIVYGNIFNKIGLQHYYSYIAPLVVFVSAVILGVIFYKFIDKAKKISRRFRVYHKDSTSI